MFLNLIISIELIIEHLMTPHRMDPMYKVASIYSVSDILCCQMPNEINRKKGHRIRNDNFQKYHFHQNKTTKNCKITNYISNKFNSKSSFIITFSYPLAN